MTLDQPSQLLSLLIDLEAVLRNIQYWDNEPPEESALQSQQPFCIDTLEFYQWLQWLFIPRMQLVVNEGHLLPSNCDITSMAEEWCKSRALHASDLLEVLQKIDKVLSG